jgi:phage/plasmid-like protein (TIGR03299 family)
MAHNLNINKITGRASFFTAREVAWHGLGTTVEQSLNSTEAIREAQLDYEVSKCPVYAKFPDDLVSKVNKKGDIVPDVFATVRTDTGEILGSVGNRYEIVQNTDAFDFVDNIVGSKEAIFETAGALGKGERIFLTAKLPDNIRIKSTDDIIKMYFLFTSSHDGSGVLKAGLTPVRVVCNNTLQLALGRLQNSISLRHTKSIHDKLKIGRELMGMYKAYNMEFADTLSHLANIPITNNIVDTTIKSILFTDAELAELGKSNIMINPDISTRKKNSYADIITYIDKGVGQEFHHGTALWLYNGISSYFNNYKNYKNEEDRFVQLTEGKAMKDTQKAFNQLLQLT